MTEVYSALKAAWHGRDIERLRNGVGIVPHHLYLIISDLCNQDCAFCTYRAPRGWGSEGFGADTGKGFTMNPNRMIARDKCFEILDDCAELGVKAVQFTGGGEPTVHPYADVILERALDLGLEVGLVTNGTRLPVPDILSRMAWVRVSVDAGCEETYARTRRSGLYARVLENIEALARIEGPVVGANFVTTRENYREVGAFCRTMKGLGVPYVKIAANLTKDGLAYYDGILDDIMKEMKEAKACADDTFTIVDVFERRLTDLRIGRPAHAFCGQQHFATYIGADLTVYRCCNTAYTEHGKLGNLKYQRFRDWLLSESFEALRGFDARSCTHCQFHERNETIAYLVQNKPTHVEFV